MTTRFRPSRPVRIVAVTAAALGLGVPAALALGDAPERPRLEEPVVRSASSDDDEATTTTTSTAPAPTVEDDDDAVDDISGPCDEAEHADDPECTGVTPASTVDDDGDEDDEDDDHGDGSGSGHRGNDHGGDEDRSGSNSGPG